MNSQEYIQERRNNPDLLDLLIIIFKYKWMIIGFLLLIYIMTFTFLYFSSKNAPSPLSSQKDRYYSECKLFIPDNLDMVNYNTMKIKLLGRSIALALGEAFNLSAISQTSWDEKSNRWVTEHVYTWNDQTKTWTFAQASKVPDLDFVATLSVKAESNMVTLRFNHNNPEVPQKALVFVLNYLSELYRKPILEYYASQKEIFRKQLAAAQDPVLKGRLFEQYSNLIDKDTRAKNKKFYGIEVIEPAFVAEKISVNSPPSAWKSKFAMIIALMTLVSLVISISLVFLLEYIKKMKADDPERFKLMHKYLRFR
jgi:hypothetical protein